MYAIVDYKAQKISHGQDWESVRTKYSDLMEEHIASYLDDEEKNQEFPKFKTSKEYFTKEKC